MVKPCLSDVLTRDGHLVAKPVAQVCNLQAYGKLEEGEWPCGCGWWLCKQA